MHKKVFLCTDTFIQCRSYYVVAVDEEQAEEEAHNTPFPDYLDHDDDSHLEHLDCTVDEEVETITLVKIGSPLSSDASPESISLILTKTDANVYQGYVVEEDKVDLAIRTYSRTEWQLFEEWKSTRRPLQCLLCTTPVKHRGNVCPQCQPRSIALRKVLFAYASQLESILQASPGRHISAPMHCVTGDRFFLKELNTPIPYGKVVITHSLSLLSLDKNNQIQQERWYGYTIGSTLMAALIDQRFPEDPNSFVPLSSWHAVLPAGAQ